MVTFCYSVTAFIVKPISIVNAEILLNYVFAILKQFICSSANDKKVDVCALISS